MPCPWTLSFPLAAFTTFVHDQQHSGVGAGEYWHKSHRWHSACWQWFPWFDYREHLATQSDVRTSTNLVELFKLMSQTWLSWDKTTLLRLCIKVSNLSSYSHWFCASFSFLDNCEMTPIGHNIANCWPFSSKSSNSLKFPSECKIPMWKEFSAVAEDNLPWLIGFLGVRHCCMCLDNAAVSLNAY